jgi:hypothetical protein
MGAQVRKPVMSSDFSIKPAGPVAAAIAQSVSTAAGDAVATDLPAHQSVAAADSSARIRNDPQAAAANSSNHVMLDRAAGTMVWQVVDNRTSLVVRQFPDQPSLRRRAYARALEQAREDALALRVDRKI